MSFLSDPDVHYDRVSAAWEYMVGEDLHHGYFSDPAYSLAQATRALTLLMAERSGISAGLEVLDAGCGTGGPAICLAREFGCKVVGISTSKIGVERARQRARDAGLSQLSFQVADAIATGYPDQSFDRVWILETSHLIQQKELLLCESARLLRPGGKLALCDIVLGRVTPIEEVLKLRREFTTLQEVWGRVKTQLLGDYARSLEQLGLETEVWDISTEVFPTFAHWKHNAEQQSDKATELLGAAELEKFLRAADIMARFSKEGRLGYGLVVATKPGAWSPGS
jgi:27-O-demethylrifamycin SV methyltransferase